MRWKNQKKNNNEREKKECICHEINGHLDKQCFQQIKKSEEFKNGTQTNGVTCTIARVIRIKSVSSRRVVVNVRTVLLLLMVEIVKNMKTTRYVEDSTITVDVVLL